MRAFADHPAFVELAMVLLEKRPYQGTPSQAAEKRLSRRENAATRAEAQTLLNDLRGAKAPLFHRTASF